jgi:hypothetical protein
VHWLTGQAALAEELAGPEHGDDALFALLRHHRESNSAPLDKKDSISRVTLPEDDLILFVPDRRTTGPNRSEHRTGVEVCLRPGLGAPRISPGGFRIFGWHRA